MNAMMDAVEKRKSRAVESILENERLTSNLDDDSAKALLDWGTACAKTAAQSTEQLTDVEADQVLSTKLRAIRRLMRSINRWIGKQQEGTAEDPTKTLDRIIEQAPVIYGEGLPSPGEELRDDVSKLLVESAVSPSLMITRLRGLIESPAPAEPTAPPEARARPSRTIPPGYQRLVSQGYEQQKDKTPPVPRRRTRPRREAIRERRAQAAARHRIQKLQEMQEEIGASRADGHRCPEEMEKQEESESPQSAQRRILEAKEERMKLDDLRTIRRRTQRDKEERGDREHE